MTREYLLELGKRVKMIRKELRISQKDFANKINISGSYLSEIEAGKSKPGYDFLFNISKICNVSLAYVLHEVGEIFTGIDIIGRFIFRRRRLSARRAPSHHSNMYQFPLNTAPVFADCTK